MIAVYIAIGAAVILLICGLAVFNGLVRRSNQVKEAFSTMDVYLKKRWDLIPNLVEVVKGYAGHEKETIAEIVKLRNGAYQSMSAAEKVDTNAKLSDGLGRLMALAESYPELKASDNYKNLSDQLAKAEEDIANARKYYNGSVRVYNDAVQSFPGRIIASICGFTEQKMFEISDREKENVKVELREKV